MEPVQVVESFVARINAQDVDGLCALMTEDHCFVDSMGSEIDGLDTLRHAWSKYFAMVPDYEVLLEEVFQDGNQIGAFGLARGTYAPNARSGGELRKENQWSTPAAWRAEVRGKKVAMWRVYGDNEPIRRLIAAAATT